MMETLIKAGSIYCCLLVCFHLVFRRLFHWDSELRKLNPLNRAIMPVLNYSLTWVFVVFAYLSWFHTQALLNSELGHTVLLGIALLWI